MLAIAGLTGVAMPPAVIDSAASRAALSLMFAIAELMGVAVPLVVIEGEDGDG
jgi:hypothetical protein